MRNNILLLTKDCMPLEALPCYGGCRYWEGKTPNIDALVKKGTKFLRHYTAGGSTAMSMSAMLTGKYLYEFESRKFYTKVKYSEYPSIFDTFQQLGYDCHLIWDKTWFDFGEKYVSEFGDIKKVIYHGVDMDQPTDGHDESVFLNNDDILLEKTLNEIREALESIDTTNKNFVWLHLPHIIKGRNAYMSDIDVFDTIVGYARMKYGDDNIYISTDHGHMNMHKHIAGYGFHSYEPIIHIPLITPRLGNCTEVNQITCNTDIPHILLEDSLPSKHDYVVSETKYYAQPGRVVAIVTDRFKYIYNASNNKEELYDLRWDPNEEYNILERCYYDVNRRHTVYYDEHYFYPFKDDAMSAYQKIIRYKKEICRELSSSEKRKMKLYNFLKKTKRILLSLKK